MLIKLIIEKSSARLKTVVKDHIYRKKIENKNAIEQEQQKKLTYVNEILFCVVDCQGHLLYKIILTDLWAHAFNCPKSIKKN